MLQSQLLTVSNLSTTTNKKKKKTLNCVLDLLENVQNVNALQLVYIIPVHKILVDEVGDQYLLTAVTQNKKHESPCFQVHPAQSAPSEISSTREIYSFLIGP